MQESSIVDIRLGSKYASEASEPSDFSLGKSHGWTYKESQKVVLCQGCDYYLVYEKVFPLVSYKIIADGVPFLIKLKEEKITTSVIFKANDIHFYYTNLTANLICSWKFSAEKFSI